MKPFDAPTGIDDFAELRGRGATYVDKTAFIVDLLTQSTKVALFPRPRRFGKTLNLSTLRYFLDVDPVDRSGLFEGLAVWDDADARAHFGRHPVVLLSFKELKATSFEAMMSGIRLQLKRWMQDRTALLDSPRVGVADRDILRGLADATASDAECREALLALSSALASHHGAPVAVLLDEYDTPIQAAWLNGYYDEAIDFFRPFLGAAFKGNPHLFKGVLTGILRVAKESIFSGLNNLAVHGILKKQYATTFGFTEPEVMALAARAGASDRIDELRAWYNGYRFGDTLVYNPWSIINALAAPDEPPAPYWLNTSDNALIRRLVVERSMGTLPEKEDLLLGGAVERPIYEAMSLREVERRPHAEWSFLLYAGYLTAESVTHGRARPLARLRIPNREVRTCFETLFLEALEGAMAPRPPHLDLLRRALLAGDAELLETLLCDILLADASYHDFPSHLGEAVYHTFVLGLLVHLRDDYAVRSNREAGLGRADVLITPRRAGEPGVVLELKVPGRDGDVDKALAAGVEQIRAKRYVAALEAEGAAPVHAMVVVFDGKLAHVRVVPSDGA